MFNQFATQASKFAEPPVSQQGSPPDSERAPQPPVPETDYMPYAEKPALSEPPYKPYGENPAPDEQPYEPYKDI